MTQEQVIAEIQKDIPAFMDKVCGKGNWIHDEAEHLYIAPDPNYKGTDFGFIAVRPDGSFFTGVRPKDVLQ